MKNEIRNIINNWDPVNLFPNAPDNEYQSEIGELYSFISKHNNYSLHELGLKVEEVFIYSFGSDVFNKTLEQCEEVAYEMDRCIKEKLTCM